VVAAAQTTMNLYPEIIETPNEPTRMVLYGRPGIKVFVQLAPPKIRAMWAGGGRLFVLHGPNFSEVRENGTVTTATQPVAEGGIPNPPDAAGIFSNGHQLMIVAGGQVYCDNGAGPEPAYFLVSGTLQSDGTNAVVWLSGQPFHASMVGRNMRINNLIHTVTGFTDPSHITVAPAVTAQAENIFSMPGYAALPGANRLTGITGGFLDGYFIVNRTWNPAAGPGDTGRTFNISELNEGTEWDPLMFGVKEGHSDYILSILCDHEELWLLGTETIEVWTNVGNPDFPFQRVPGAFIHEGLVAPFAPCSVGQTVCWLGGGASGQTVAYRAQGFQPQRISTHAEEIAWNAPGFETHDAVSYAYTDAGHLFWVINFWEEQQTWVYDMTSGFWHQRAAWDAGNLRFLGYQPWYHVFIPEWGIGGKHIGGDPRTGILYDMSLNFYDDGGNAIEYLRAFPHLLDEDKYQFHHRLEVYLESGAVTAAEPQLRVGLDWSDDRGHTFAHGRFALAGANGQYTKRVVWRRLGKSRDRVYRVGIEGKSKVALIDAFLEATPGIA
jgi:hypothetical protein